MSGMHSKRAPPRNTPHRARRSGAEDVGRDEFFGGWCTGHGSNVDLDAMTVLVDRQLSGTNRLTKVKTAKARRTISIDDTSRDTLREWAERQTVKRDAAGPRWSDGPAFIVTTRLGTSAALCDQPATERASIASFPTSCGTPPSAFRSTPATRHGKWPIGPAPVFAWSKRSTATVSTMSCPSSPSTSPASNKGTKKGDQRPTKPSHRGR